MTILIITSVKLFNSGDEIVAGEDIYGGSYRLLSQVTPKNGILVKSVVRFTHSSYVVVFL